MNTGAQTSYTHGTKTSYHRTNSVEPMDTDQHDMPHSGLRDKLERKIDTKEEKNLWPSFPTTFLAVAGFIIFGIVGCVVIGYPTTGARIVLPIIAFIIDVCILVAVYRDIPKKKSMRRNVANTVLLIFLAILLMTFLYEFVWYNGRTRSILKFSIEEQATQRYPGVVVLTDPNYPQQANLMVNPRPLCFVGVAQHNEPYCNTLSSEKISDITQGNKGENACNCSTYWDSEIRPSFPNATNFNYLTFTPGPEMITSKPLTFMNLVLSFNFNSSNGIPMPYRLNPSLWILVFDPNKPAEMAYEEAGSGFTLVDANSQVIVNLTPRVIKNDVHASKSPVNNSVSYDTDISTIHNLDQPCDVAHNYTAPCEAHISLKFATFDEEVTTIEDTSSFGDIIESVGAFYALAQLVAWIFSGVAWIH